MFKSKLVTGLFLFVLLMGACFAQSSNKTGIGIAIIDLQKIVEMAQSEGIGGNATITIPFIMSPTMRLEPEVGYYSFSQKGSYQGYTGKETLTAWNIGAGLFLQKIYSEFTLYYGGRIGYVSQKDVEEQTGQPDDELTTSGLYFGPAIGGEHNFSEHFSIGAEAQVIYAPLKNEVDGRPYDVDITLINTRALVFFRFYF